MARPDAGVAVGLQLGTYRDRVRLGLARPLPRRLRLFGDALQRLHVMPDLVRDDVRLREVAARAELFAQVSVEAEVDVDLFVERAIKRTDGGLRIPARGLHDIGEQDEPRFAVIAPGT